LQPWGIGIILLAAGLLFFADLRRESIWLDEAASRQAALQRNPAEVIRLVRGADNNPPLHFLLLHYTCKWMGSADERAIRLPSAILSVLSVWMIYRLGRLLFGPASGLTAAGLAVCSGFLLDYAQEARPYALFAFLSLGSFYALLILLEKNASVKISFTYGLFTVLLLYTHPYGPFVLAAQNMAVFTGWIIRRKCAKPSWPIWLVLQGVIFLAWLPWILILFHKAVHFAGQPAVLGRPRIWDIPGCFKQYCGDFLWPALLCIALSLLTLRPLLATTDLQNEEDWPAAWRADRRQAWIRLFFLGWWIAIPILIPFVISQVSSPIFLARYTIPCAYPFFLLTAAGIGTLGRIRIPVLILAAALLLGGLVPRYGTVKKEQWRQAVPSLESEAESGELVLFFARYCQTPFDVYAHRSDLVKAGVPFEGHPHTVDARTLRQIEMLVQGRSRLWLVVSHSAHKEQQILDYLSCRFEILQRREYCGIQIYHLERKP
jgi:4-amino-4-deoxy-L-arabinose transferase-like glycosyltransferase